MLSNPTKIFRFMLSSFIMKLDCSSACAAPDYSAVAASNEAAAEKSYQAAKDRLDFDKQQYAEAQPYIQQLRDVGISGAKKAMEVADENQQHANEEWGNYQSTYRPIEQQSALEAMGIRNLSSEDAARLTQLMGSEGQAMDPQAREQEVNALVQKSTDLAAGRAVTNAEAQQNSAVTQATESLQRLGVDPSKIAAGATTLANNATLAKIGAGESAREAAVNQGVTLRAAQENFGKGSTNTAAGAYGLTLQGGSTATGNAGAAATAGLANSAPIDAAYGMTQTAAGQQMQSNNAYGNMLTQGYSAQLQAQNASDSGMGSFLGMAGSMGLKYALSSRKFKHGGKPVSGEAALNGISNLDIEKWIYNEEFGGDENIGPYAEDMHREFGDVAAPKGKVINIITAQGLQMAALKEVAKRLDDIDAELGIRKAA